MGMPWNPITGGFPGQTAPGVKFGMSSAGGPPPSSAQPPARPSSGSGSSSSPSLAQLLKSLGGSNASSSSSGTESTSLAALLEKLSAAKSSGSSSSSTSSTKTTQAKSGFDPMMMVMMLMMMKKRKKATPKTESTPTTTTPTNTSSTSNNSNAAAIPSVQYSHIWGYLSQFALSTGITNNQFTAAQLREAASSTAPFTTAFEATTAQNIKTLLGQIATGLEANNTLVDSNRDNVFGIEATASSGSSDLLRLARNNIAADTTISADDFGVGKDLAFATANPDFNTTYSADFEKLREFALVNGNQLSAQDLAHAASVLKLRGNTQLANVAKRLQYELSQTGNAIDANKNGAIDFVPRTTNSQWASGELFDLIRVNGNVLSTNAFSAARLADGSVSRLTANGLPVVTADTPTGNQVVFSAPNASFEIDATVANITSGTNTLGKGYTNLNFKTDQSMAAQLVVQNNTVMLVDEANVMPTTIGIGNSFEFSSPTTPNVLSFKRTSENLYEVKYGDKTFEVIVNTQGFDGKSLNIRQI